MNAPNDYKPSFRGLAPEHSGWRHSRNLIYASFASQCAHAMRMCAYARISAHAMRLRACYVNARMRCECSHMHAFPRMRCECAHAMRCECAHQGGTYAVPNGDFLVGTWYLCRRYVGQEIYFPPSSPLNLKLLADYKSKNDGLDV